MNGRVIFKKEVSEEEEGMPVAMESAGEGLKREETVERRDMGGKTGENKFVCGDGVEEENVLSFTEETWPTGGRQEVVRGREIDEVAEMGFQLEWS